MRITNDDYKPSLLSEEELAHYGVKGMRWGVRRDQASLDRAAGRKPRKDINDTKFGKLANKNAQRYMNKQAEKAAKKALKRAEKEKVTREGLTGHPAVILGAFAAVAVYQQTKLYLDSGRKDAKETGDRDFKKKPELKEPMTHDELHKNVVKQINPGYPAQGTKMNCRRATLAYEMRRRGNDVQATESKHASGQTPKGMEKAIGVTFKDSLWGEKPIFRDTAVLQKNAVTPMKKAETVFDSLGKNPNGARGELGLAWTMGGGHSIAWEIVDNKPVIFDTQNGKKYSTPKEFSAFTPVMFEAASTRLDNRTIDEEFIKRWVKDV